MNSGHRPPDASYSALFAFLEDRTRVTPEETIQRVAEPMFAAYLRELAGLHGYTDSDGVQCGIVDCATLVRLADELLPPEVDAADGQPADAAVSDSSVRTTP